MLEMALLTGRVHFVDLLLDFSQDGNVKDFDDFVTLDRLRLLYYHVLTKVTKLMFKYHENIFLKKQEGFQLYHLTLAQ